MIFRLDYCKVKKYWRRTWLVAALMVPGCTDDDVGVGGSETTDGRPDPCLNIEQTQAELDYEEVLVAEIVSRRNVPDRACPGVEDPIEGIQPVVRDSALDCAARLHASNLEQSNEFSQQFEGETLEDRLSSAGYAGPMEAGLGPRQAIARGFGEDADFLLWGLARNSEDCQTMFHQPYADETPIPMAIGVGVSGSTVVIVTGGEQ